ncbi:25299_t:CDS:1, partial [Racocetra persica]
SEIPISFENNNEDNIYNKNENIDNKSNNYDNNDNSLITTLSKEIFNYIGHILGINASVTSPFNTPELTEPMSNETNINILNIIAICKQEFKEFLEFILRSLQILQENLILFRSLIKSEQLSAQELYNMNNNHILMTHFCDLITSNSFKKVQNLVNIIYKDTNPHRCITSGNDILFLKRENKQKRKLFYKN